MNNEAHTITLNENQKLARSKICLPLDNLETLEQLQERVEELAPVVGMFKIGKESFTRFGPQAIELVHNAGAQVFLDLKYHDIPNTVQGACDAAAQLGVAILNVHASGGVAMMKAAKLGAENGAKKVGLKPPKIIAVTILTSIDETILKNDLGIVTPLSNQVLLLAQKAAESGMDGIVCSAQDLESIRPHLPANFYYITPGIAGPVTGVSADQKRVMTPGAAIKAGSSLLVVGRAITGPKTKEERIEAGLAIINDIVPYL